MMTRHNPIRGEWWIDEAGQAQYADADIGDISHEGMVMQNARALVLAAVDIDDMDYGEWPDEMHHYYDLIRERLDEPGLDDDDIRERLIEVVRALPVIRDSQQATELVDLAYGEGDARLYAMVYDGWIRVAGNNVEMWTATKSDLRRLADGLYDAYQDEAEETTYNIEVVKTQKYYTAVPFDDIASGRIAQHRVNPSHRQKNPYELPEDRKDTINNVPTITKKKYKELLALAGGLYGPNWWRGLSGTEKAEVLYYEWMHNPPEKARVEITENTPIKVRPETLPGPNTYRSPAFVGIGYISAYHKYLYDGGNVIYSPSGKYRSNFGDIRIPIDVMGWNGIRYYGTWYCDSGFADIKAYKGQFLKSLRGIHL